MYILGFSARRNYAFRIEYAVDNQIKNDFSEILTQVAEKLI